MSLIRFEINVKELGILLNPEKYESIIKVGFLRGTVTQYSHQLHQGNMNNTADMRVFFEINSKMKYNMKKIQSSLFANYFPIATGMLAGFVLCYVVKLFIG